MLDKLVHGCGKLFPEMKSVSDGSYRQLELQILAAFRTIAEVKPASHKQTGIHERSSEISGAQGSLSE